MNTLLGSVVLHRGHHDLGTYLLLSHHVESGDTHLLSRDLKGTVSAGTLPARAAVRSTISLSDSRGELLADVDGVSVLLRWWKAGGSASASGPSAEAVTAVLDELVRAVPTPAEPRKVQVVFTDSRSSDRHVWIDASPWSEIAGQYPTDVRAALDGLMVHEPDPTQRARRLVLWHGRPGTGKTSAIRALLHAWRDWADGVVVTDPEVLLADGAYLRDAVLDHENDDRWLVLVLEDSESLLHKGTGGASLSKLLNLCDGLLGQGLRCLFLITTNEPLDAVHPALVRPGRCLARIEFGALPPAQAAALLGRPVDRAMTLAEVMSAKPTEVLAEQVPVGQYL